MTINVYWACLEKEWLRANEPVDISQRFLNKDVLDNSYKQCPALRKELKNLYGVESIYEYSFELDNNEIKTKYYDQEFFDWHVLPRSPKDGLFSFSQEFVFFTDEPTLVMSANLPPYLEDNFISERCIAIPGCYDIGKWYRPVEFAFFMKKNFNEFKINQGEIYQYIKFQTNETINFIQFKESEKLKKYLKDLVNIRKNKTIINSLNYYYKKFSMKNIILKEIKENLL